MNDVAPFLSNKQLVSDLISRPGLIPISIDVNNNTVRWADIGKYHFYEGFFHKSLNNLSAIKKGALYCCTTGIDVLNNQRLIPGSLYPTGFIFHTGRSGSTLLAKAIARSPVNLMISEAAPLNQVLQLFNKNDHFATEKQMRIYRNLVLALGRQRLLSHKQLFIKFTSFNILFFNFIHDVFPDVPSVCLKRPIDQIVASFSKNPPGWLNNAGAILKLSPEMTFPGLNEIVECFFKAAEQSSGCLKQIDYGALTPENLPGILRFFDVYPDEFQLSLMQSQFKYDSKVEFQQKKFNT